MLRPFKIFPKILHTVYTERLCAQNYVNVRTINFLMQNTANFAKIMQNFYENIHKIS